MKLTSTILSLGLAAVATADTLTVNTFSDLVCGDSTHHFNLGQLNTCHLVSEGFRSFTTTNVAQSFFNRNIKVKVWSTNNCQPSSTTVEGSFALSNAADNCHVPFADVNEGLQNPYKVFSFQLVVES